MNSSILKFGGIVVAGLVVAAGIAYLIIRSPDKPDEPTLPSISTKSTVDAGSASGDLAGGSRSSGVTLTSGDIDTTAHLTKIRGRAFSQPSTSTRSVVDLIVPSGGDPNSHASLLLAPPIPPEDPAAGYPPLVNNKPATRSVRK